MIETSRDDGKKSDMTRSPILVVAGALGVGTDRWLMHRRPYEKHHGGLWEFPGGKVEPLEMPVDSLARELSEELGIAIDTASCRPAGFAETRGEEGGPPIVILLYTIGSWEGAPSALEGGRIEWFTAEQVRALDKPPLDRDLAAQLFEKG